MTRAIAMGLALLATSAGAQTEGDSPEDEFLPWAPADPAPAAPAPAASPAPPPAPVPHVASPASSSQPARPFNRVSLYGAPTLGQGNRGLGVHVGFPLLGIKAAVGVADALDLGLGFDSFYGVMNEPRAFARWQWLRGEHWSGALVMEGGLAWFTQRPETEQMKGPRALTGRRNYNAELGAVFSYQGSAPRAARLFADLRYHLAFDTQPWSEDPLGGVPPAVVLGHNVPVRMGAELPFSSSSAFLFMFGFDVHGRAQDLPFMPTVSVGLTTGF